MYGNLNNSCDVPAHGGQDFIPISMSALPLTTHRDIQSSLQHMTKHVNLFLTAIFGYVNSFLKKNETIFNSIIINMKSREGKLNLLLCKSLKYKNCFISKVAQSRNTFSIWSHVLKKMYEITVTQIFNQIK